MNLPDIYTITLLSGVFKNFELTNNSFYDTLIIGFIGLIYLLGDNRKFKDFIFRNFMYIIEGGDYNKFQIVVKDKNVPISFKAVLWYISNNKNSTIKYVEELSNFSWDRHDNLVEADKFYVIHQTNKFKITNDIYGKMSKENVETGRRNDYIEYNDHYNLVLYSKEKSLSDIIEWVNQVIKEYKRYMKLKTIDSQLLLSISYQDELNVDSCSFESTATFQNSYLPNYDEIMGKIDFFLNNKDWYDRKGIPYNLGIMLYGEPGCGKTRFIKQLMNYTGRHGVDIKLNNKFCFNTLKNIIHNENITDEFIIPQEKRIIIFEDIDAMCEILKDRDLINNEETLKLPNESNKKKDESKTLLFDMDTKNNLNNNNLSFFLNIIDGLNECSGRIIIMTTNKIDYLDKAIIRPGRIDIKINFKKYEKKDVCGIINRFWNKNFNIDDLKENINEKYTSAEIVNMFRSTECFNDIKDIFLK
jgi:ATP-dependent Zn protease